MGSSLASNLNLIFYKKSYSCASHNVGRQSYFDLQIIQTVRLVTFQLFGTVVAKYLSRKTFMERKIMNAYG